MQPSEREPREVTENHGRVFDVQPSRDDESLNYPVRSVLASTVEPKRRCWLRGPMLDQGSEGACVGHGVTQELASTPVRVDFKTAGMRDAAPTDAQAFAFWLYRRAQAIDEWPGTDYSGTSLNAGMKVARNLGMIDGWRWASTYDDLRDSLITKGPVVIAIPWLSGMYEAPGGELRAVGNEVGWHCILVNGYDPRHTGDGVLADGGRREMFRLCNSWGSGWGTGGHAWMEAGALWNLIDENGGEMAVALGRTLTATP